MEAGHVVFEDDVYAVSSQNDKGPFDILPMHSNFITLIAKHITVHMLDRKKKEFDIDGGLLRNRHNNVEIFLGIEAAASAAA